MDSVASLCSRTAHARKVLGARAQLETATPSMLMLNRRREDER